MTTRREENKKKVSQTLEGLLESGSGLDAVLDEYDKIRNAPERFGLCHDIAVAIILDLHHRKLADGWEWCRGTVDGGTDHSWVEYGGWCIDMGDDDNLRVWEAVHPEINIDGQVVRRTTQETLAWVYEQEQRWIAEAAYFRWRARGCGGGRDQEDWFLAERDLLLDRLCRSDRVGDGPRAFRFLNELSLGFGVIDLDLFAAREAYLADLYARLDRSSALPADRLEEKRAERGEREGEAGEAATSRSNIPEGHPDIRRDGNKGPDWVEFMPGGPIAHLKRWLFIKGDPDPHPAVPHGHRDGKPFPKLDPYLGSIHVSTTETSGRLSKDDTRALWNDQRFRDFAAEALVHFIGKNPKYVWRVANPRRLPRSR